MAHGMGKQRVREELHACVRACVRASCSSSVGMDGILNAVEDDGVTLAWTDGEQR